MPIIRKFKKGVYQFSNLFKISNPVVNIGDDEVKEIVPFRGIIQTEGDLIKADDFNEMQRNNVFFVNCSYNDGLGTGKDGYNITNLESEQDLFDGLKIKIIVPKTNLFDSCFVILDKKEYEILKTNEQGFVKLKKGDLIKNEIINLIFIDNKFIIEKKVDSFIKHSDIATETKDGIVKYGTVEKTALEGKKLSEIIGLEFGGYVSKIQNKEKGKAYINDLSDNNLYVCIEDHTSTSFNSIKFEDITNYGLLRKLNDLIEIKELTKIKESLYFSISTSYKFGNLYIINLILSDNQNTINYINSLPYNTELENIFNCFSETKGKRIKNGSAVIIPNSDFFLKSNGVITLGASVRNNRISRVYQQITSFIVLN